MSYVSNVILSFSIMEDEKARLRDINGIIERLGTNGRFKDLPYSATGGTKALERPTFISAFNYLSIPNLITEMKSIRWDRPDQVQLFVCDQEEDVYWLRYPDTERIKDIAIMGHIEIQKDLRRKHEAALDVVRSVITARSNPNFDFDAWLDAAKAVIDGAGETSLLANELSAHSISKEAINLLRDSRDKWRDIAHRLAGQLSVHLTWSDAPGECHRDSNDTIESYAHLMKGDQ